MAISITQQQFEVAISLLQMAFEKMKHYANIDRYPRQCFCQPKKMDGNESQESQGLNDNSSPLSHLAPEDRFLLRFTAGWVYATIVTVGVSLFESRRQYKEAIEYLTALLQTPYSPGRHGHWWNRYAVIHTFLCFSSLISFLKRKPKQRLALNLEHLGQKQKAMQTCERALQDEYVRGGDRLTLERRLDRLCKPPRRWKKPIHLFTYLPFVKKPIETFIRGRPLQTVAGRKNQFVSYRGNFCNVEELALEFYELKGGWQGCHCEGSILRTLFSLLFWDILFCDVPHVFQTPYQGKITLEDFLLKLILNSNSFFFFFFRCTNGFDNGCLLSFKKRED
jgi:tetratricopeptide (TPR) repeat protein